MTKIISRTTYFVFLIFTISCNFSSENKIINHTPNHAELKPNSLPNDEFREYIIPSITEPQDLIIFEELLSTLDKNNLTFCQFVKQLFVLDDSCYSVAKQKYPDPSQHAAFAKVHDKAIKEAQNKYLETLNLNKDMATFASVAYSFDSKIKLICGNY